MGGHGGNREVGETEKGDREWSSLKSQNEPKKTRCTEWGEQRPLAWEDRKGSACPGGKRRKGKEKKGGEEISGSLHALWKKAVPLEINERTDGEALDDQRVRLNLGGIP